MCYGAVWIALFRKRAVRQACIGDARFGSHGLLWFGKARHDAVGQDCLGEARSVEERRILDWQARRVGASWGKSQIFLVGLYKAGLASSVVLSRGREAQGRVRLGAAGMES